MGLLAVVVHGALLGAAGIAVDSCAGAVRRFPFASGVKLERPGLADAALGLSFCLGICWQDGLPLGTKNTPRVHVRGLAGVGLGGRHRL